MRDSPLTNFLNWGPIGLSPSGEGTADKFLNNLLACACSCGNSTGGVGGSSSSGGGTGKSLHVSYRSGYSKVPIGVIQPRAFKPYEDIITIPKEAFDESGIAHIEVRATKRHIVKGVRCFSAQPQEVAENVYQPSSLKIKRGRCTSDVAPNSTQLAQLVPGDEMELMFDLGTAKVGTCLLEARGFYTPMSAETERLVGNWLDLLNEEEKRLLYDLYIASGKPLISPFNTIGKPTIALFALLGLVFGGGHFSKNSFLDDQTQVALSLGVATAHASHPSGSSTPLLKSWNGSRYTVENDFLFGSPISFFTSRAGGEAALQEPTFSGDKYLLQNLQVDANGQAKLLIKEIEPEESFYEKIQLRTLSTNSKQNVYVTHDYGDALVFDAEEQRKGALKITSDIPEEPGDITLKKGDSLYFKVKKREGNSNYLLINSYFRDWILGDSVPFSLFDKVKMKLNS